LKAKKATKNSKSMIYQQFDKFIDFLSLGDLLVKDFSGFKRSP
jgi:hypothetical protein